MLSEDEGSRFLLFGLLVLAAVGDARSIISTKNRLIMAIKDEIGKIHIFSKKMQHGCNFNSDVAYTDLIERESCLGKAERPPQN